MLALAAASQALNLTDTDMFASNWTIDEFVLFGSGSVGESNIASGNPGNARRIFNNMDANSGIAGVHLHDQAVLTIQQGGIADVTMSLDTLTSASIMGVGLIIKQSGKYYVADYGATSLSIWQTYGNTYNASNFVEVVFGNGITFDGNSNPDFNLVGSQLQFGYIAANSSANPVTVPGDFDNFSVQAVPEPATLSLLAVSALIGIHRKKAI